MPEGLPKKLALLAFALEECEGELRADLQQVYGVDLDRAMAGGHTAWHVACLVRHLPTDSRVFSTANPDAPWRLEHTLLAAIANSLNGLAYGLSDRRRRGSPPVPIGPSWMARGKSRSLEARLLTIDELKEELSKPRE